MAVCLDACPSEVYVLWNPASLVKGLSVGGCRRVKRSEEEVGTESTRHVAWPLDSGMSEVGPGHHDQFLLLLCAASEFLHHAWPRPSPCLVYARLHCLDRCSERLDRLV